MKFKQLNTEFEYFYPKMTNFWTHIASTYSLYIYLIYEQPLCKILYQYINKYEYYKYFPISCDFFTEFWLFYPKNSEFWNYSVWHYV